MFIEQIRDTGHCIGCNNCKNICPVSAISMISDKEGFLIPNVDYNKCVNCAKCEKVCPNYKLKYKKIDDFPEAFLVKAKNKQLLKTTASGGVCTLLAQYFINEKRGYVCGAVYDENFKVVHIVTNSLSEIERMRQSKYAQSNLEKCFIEIENKLKQDIHILFIGTGCQVYALKRFLGKEYATLYSIDLICHGVPSPKVQQEYVKYLQTKGGMIKHINNRYKKLYKHSYVSTYLTEYKNGKKSIKRYSDDPMADAFFSHLSIRNTCFHCAFKTLHRLSDITVGDFWFSEQYGFEEDLLGINLCLVQSERGKELLKFIENEAEKIIIDSKTAIVLNGGMLYSSCPENKNRTMFFERLGSVPFEQLVFKYDGKSKLNKVKNFLRELLAPFLRLTRYYNKQLVKSAKERLNRTIPDDKTGLMYYEDFDARSIL